MYPCFFKMAVDGTTFLTCPKRNNHAALGKCQKAKSELSSKPLKMRTSDAKSVKMVHFPIFQIAETKQSCGVSDNPTDNLTLQRYRVSLSFQSAETVSNQTYQLFVSKVLDNEGKSC